MAAEPNNERRIAPGDVDERSIEDVRPDDLRGYTQCHFFAGIGAWSYALRNAGWSDDRPVWTLSCPCQPFSSAGEGAGFADERHLWPAAFHFISECRPVAIIGEQVEAAIRHSWLDLVQTDLENLGYAFGATGLPACGIGAPHIRQRIFFVADAEFHGLQGRVDSVGGQGRPVCDDDLPTRAVRVASWPTPVANDDNKTPEAHLAMKDRMGGNRTAITSLQVMSKYVGWPTPTGCDSNRQPAAEPPLANVTLNHAASWVTPSARDWKDTPGMATTGTDPDGSTRQRVDQLPRQAAQMDFGATATGYPSVMGKSARLNPALSRWLMGLPPSWDDCAPTATPSSRRSRKSS